MRAVDISLTASCRSFSVEGGNGCVENRNSPRKVVSVGIVRGLAAPFRGALFVARHRLWSYFVLPLLLNLALATGAAWGGIALARDRFGPRLAEWSPVLLWVLLPVLGLLIALLFFIVGQPVLSAPFVDLLTEKSERIVRGQAVSIGLLRSTWQAILHGVLKMMLYLFALGVTLGLGALTGLGGLLGAALYGLFLAFDGFDYPLARRGSSFWGKWQYLASHPGQTLGYCLGASLLYLVPLMALIAPGFAAVGATLAYLEGESGPENRRHTQGDR
jgi:uncharacterized protein involved in cysteine biosynthesis